MPVAYTTTITPQTQQTYHHGPLVSLAAPHQKTSSVSSAYYTTPNPYAPSDTSCDYTASIYTPSSSSTSSAPSYTSQPAQPVYTPAPATIPIQKRRLHLTKIPGVSSRKEIEKRILDAVGAKNASTYKGLIEEIELPLHPDGRPRGHALILLVDEEVTARVEKALNGLVVRGPDGQKRSLKVKKAQEGATDPRALKGLMGAVVGSGYAPSVSASASAAVSSRSSAGLKAKHGSGSSGNGGGSNASAVAQKEDKARRPSNPVIVNGSAGVPTLEQEGEEGGLYDGGDRFEEYGGMGSMQAPPSQQVERRSKERDGKEGKKHSSATGSKKKKK
jgi:hypothetical protein